MTSEQFNTCYKRDLNKVFLSVSALPLTFLYLLSVPQVWSLPYLKWISIVSPLFLSQVLVYLTSNISCTALMGNCSEKHIWTFIPLPTNSVLASQCREINFKLLSLACSLLICPLSSSLMVSCLFTPPETCWAPDLLNWLRFFKNWQLICHF